jgi:hypothetical protein
MRSWFSRRATPNGEPAPLDAYKQGRVDEHDRLAKTGTAATSTRGETDAAYDRGRRDERLRHRGHPLITFLLVILSLAALAMIYLGVRTGSFAAAGAVVDSAFSSGVQRANSPVVGAENKAGSALENAGANLKNRASGQP